MSDKQPQLNEIRKSNSEKAIIFLHGFSGKRDETWGQFPGFIGTLVTGWDIYTLGYATSFQPDVGGIWSADPDLPILAKLFKTQMIISPLNQYQKFTFIAHSMGGLIIQKAIIDDENLNKRVENFLMFGTPSGGLRKASWLKFWKRQFRNMGKNSPFMIELRSQWDKIINGTPSFCLKVIAGTNDQFVNPESSLGPFDEKFHYVVPGNHLDIVKPHTTATESVRLVVSVLKNGCQGIPPIKEPYRLAAERPTENILQTIDLSAKDMTETEVVDAALALDRAGKRNESMELLHRFSSLGTDIQGTLAGRIKRLWLEDETIEHAQHAMSLYKDALKKALDQQNHDQIYYHSVNIAFIAFVAYKDKKIAQEMALLAIDNCTLAKASYWNTATQAEANLYLENYERAIKLYEQATIELGSEPKWKLDSTGMQAAVVASKLENKMLVEAVDNIFSPHAKDIKNIFLSYSHADTRWMQRLKTMLKPYLREAEQELSLYSDTEIKPGDQWRKEINSAIENTSIAVLLVSANFLASDFVSQVELPIIFNAVKNRNLRLLWVYLSPSGYEETELRNFQAANNLKKPLSKMRDAEADQVLKEIAVKIKEAALSFN